MESKNIIYINGNFLAQPITGVQRFGIEILKALDELSVLSSYQFIILAYTRQTALPYTFKNIIIKRVGIFEGKLWEQTDLWFASLGKLLITFAGGAPVFKRQQFFAIHDAAIYDKPAGFSAIYRYWYYVLNAIISKSVKRIITVSLFSKERLANKLHIPSGKISVIHNAGNHIDRITADNSALNKIPAGHKLVLCVGSLNPNKNFQQVIQVAGKLQTNTDIHFAVVGNINNKVFRGSASYAASLSLPNITYLGAVSDGALKALYTNANCFLFLSLYEGFGIPVVEAMTCGCPVICSNATCLPELFEKYCCMIDPNNNDAIANSIIEILYNSEVSQAYKQKARAGASKYNWTASAQQLLRLIDENK